MPTILHHQDLLLDDAEIVTGFEFDHFDCRELFMTVTLRVGGQNPAGLVDIAVCARPDSVEQFIVFRRISATDIRTEKARVGVARRYPTPGPAPRGRRVATGRSGRRFEGL
jgi:hypothetical protein